jgi:hypothetical protein
MSIRTEGKRHQPGQGQTPASAAPRKLLDFGSIGWIVVLSVVLMFAFAWQLVWPVVRHSRQVASAGAAAPASNGFDLSTCLVRRDQIIRSVPRDHIAALTAPRIIAGSAVEDYNKLQREKYHRKFLVSGDRVIGVVLGGEARAYPLNVMNWHEVVNDTLGGVPICVTYNPLGDSAVVFSRSVDGAGLEFGVSGLLLNSNLLLYDHNGAGRESSLWSQLGCRAVSGPAAQSATRLQVLPAQLTQWSDWQARHPDTSVLLGDEKLLDRYNASPYSNYFELGRMRFPVDPAPPADGPPAFTRVLALQVAGAWQVYSCDAIIAHCAATGVWRDKGLSFHYVPQSAALDPACIWVESSPERTADPAIYSLWFTWHAANPAALPPAG